MNYVISVVASFLFGAVLLFPAYEYVSSLDITPAAKTLLSYGGVCGMLCLCALIWHGENDLDVEDEY